MALTFQAVRLDSSAPDQDARLVFRDGRLLAVATRLSDIHGELAGRWYVEVTFGAVPNMPDRTFASLPDVEAWLDGSG